MARRRKPKQPRIKREGKAQRNPYALIAQWRTGAGTHQNRKKAQDKKACRGRVNQEE
jgi:hypothetical protein